MASPRRDDTTGISHNSSHIITVIDVQPVDNEDTDDNASIGTFSCELCLSVVPQSAVHTMTCGHSCCVPCLRQGVAVALGSGAVPAQCPYYCGIALTPMEVAAIAGPEVYAKYSRLLALKSSPNMRECPFCGRLQEGRPEVWRMVCGRPAVMDVEPAVGHQSPASLRARLPRGSDGSIATSAAYGTFSAVSSKAPPLPGDSDGKSSEAGGCGAEFCFHHSNAHAGLSCEEYSAAGGPAGSAASENLIGQLTKPCPHCGTRIELAGGCNHMRCPSCRGDFCFNCGQANMTGKYVRECPNCRQSYLDHKYFPMYTCLILLLFPLFLLFTVIWFTIMALIFTCSRTVRANTRRGKCCAWWPLLCCPVAMALIFSQVIHDDPFEGLAELSQPQPTKPLQMRLPEEYNTPPV